MTSLVTTEWCTHLSVCACVCVYIHRDRESDGETEGEAVLIVTHKIFRNTYTCGSEEIMKNHTSIAKSYRTLK